MIFNPIPLTLPGFLNQNFDYELAYVPSDSNAARNITEMVKKDLNFNFKGQKGKYWKYFSGNVLV